MLAGKKIILGITGSIAAIKAPILARELMRRGASVHPALTPGALQFTTATALSALTRNSAITSVFPADKAAAGDAGTWHVHLARSADAMLIAPASATAIGHLAAGIYDNAVTLLASSLRRSTPLVIAPAMDEEMWLQPAVQENLKKLQTFGVQVIAPAHGALASGLTGMGRMPEPEDLVQRFTTLIAPHGPLAGKRILITGGPTYEPIDAVRFIGNRSSGKMAAALAEEAQKLGAHVDLVMGPSAVQTSAAIARENVETASEMERAVMAKLPKADVVIMNAAVADFKAAEASDTKLKKREMNTLAIALAPTTDILSEISKNRTGGQFVVGFALEKSNGSNSAHDYALAKLKEKKLDMIVLNDLSNTGAGFSHDTNQVSIYLPDGEEIRTALTTKQECAREILERIAQRLPTRTN
jgi:phosphopantothenoylcysteine decarboxylase/phosphopantothenate--cysteine ligase